jgi:hypothetical protein
LRLLRPCVIKVQDSRWNDKTCTLVKFVYLSNSHLR